MKDNVTDLVKRKWIFGEKKLTKKAFYSWVPTLFQISPNRLETP